MWTTDQRKRLVLEHQILQQGGLTQFSVYYYQSSDAYAASGTAISNSERSYEIYIPIPTGFPRQRPSMYVTKPCPLRTVDGVEIQALGVSHQMHVLTPSPEGWVQICHWRDNRWHPGILLQKVFLKGLLWIEAYEQHLATGRPLADFVTTMRETA